MSLYYEAAEFLDNPSQLGGSLKSRIYAAQDLKSSPAQVYALISNSSKWAKVLKEVLENSGILEVERKLNPTLAFLLAYDLLINNEIAASDKNNLKKTILRNKTRLTGEFTKARVRRGFSTIEAFRKAIESTDSASALADATKEDDVEGTELVPLFKQPRWVRINTLIASLEKQVASTFAGFKRAKDLAEVMEARQANGMTYHVDEHIPNLLALPRHTDLWTTEAYQSGLIIFQDKASCFPAYLLHPQSTTGDVIDACAAPGNKTTHLAALLNQSSDPIAGRRIFAFERDRARTGTLRTMTATAKADVCLERQRSKLEIHCQDFLDVNPAEFKGVGALLLDPSCSGSGILGRDDTLNGTSLAEFLSPNLPVTSNSRNSKKRKRKTKMPVSPVRTEDVPLASLPVKPSPLGVRLRQLSAFQVRLLTHAMTFPAARRIVYSTCSIHAAENEHVVLEALAFSGSKAMGWRVLKREEQPEGLRRWERRGDENALKKKPPSCERLNDKVVEILEDRCGGLEEIKEACIRCEKGGEEGTMGFFVCGFVRDVRVEPQIHALMVPAGKDGEDEVSGADPEDDEDEEWEGFSDGE